MQTSRLSPIRSRRLIVGLVLVVLGLVATGCADDGELGGPQIGGSSAASIGNVDLTSADLEAEVEAWASNPGFVGEAIGLTELGAPGRRSGDLVAFVLGFRIVTEQAKQLADEQGVPINDGAIDQGIQQLDAQFTDPSTGTPLFAGYSDDFRREIVTSLAWQDTLNQTLAAGGEPPPASVNPRYGNAVDVGSGIVQVERPSGPLDEPSAGSLPQPPSP